MAFERIAPADTELERTARLRLSRTRRVGPVAFNQLMIRFGSAVRALAELPNIVKRNGGAFSPPKPEHVEEELRRGAAIGARLVLTGDADYPGLLRQADGAPPALWTLGPLVVTSRAVAIVGARNASAAGQKMAQALAHALGEAGYLVVSGMARGIDTRAHAASLATGTVAVLGGGIDDIYPPENTALYGQIVEAGLLVSESPVGYSARAQDFPRRNRLISGLSLATVVVEAELKSGSLITARLAAEQNREVFAVPGSPLDPRARGCNDLLRQGAHVCEAASDILHVLENGGLDEPPADFAPPAAPRPDSGPDSSIEDRIVKAARQLLASISPVPVHRDDLIRLTGEPAFIVLAALTELEISGRIDALDGGFYVSA